MFDKLENCLKYTLIANGFAYSLNCSCTLELMQLQNCNRPILRWQMGTPPKLFMAAQQTFFRFMFLGLGGPKESFAHSKFDSQVGDPPFIAGPVKCYNDNRCSRHEAHLQK